VLLDAQGGALHLPVCDHYSGVEARMRKSLQLQAEMMREFGTCVFDVTLDCEDGAPVGQEAAHARLVASLARGAEAGARVAARVHAVDHASFVQDLDIIVGEAGDRLCHLMLPKVESVTTCCWPNGSWAAWAAANCRCMCSSSRPLPCTVPSTSRHTRACRASPSA
jgi:citrate lyase subunit beta/citryl-CoA lyase